MNFESQFTNDDRDTTEWFKASEGDNRIRILETPLRFAQRYGFGVCYEGAPYCQQDSLKEGEKLQVRFLTRVLHEGAVKLWAMPYTVAKQVLELKKSEDYVFEHFPMPYDITLKVKNAGDKSVEYTLLPAKKESPIADEIIEQIATDKPVTDILEAMKDKARKKSGPETEETPDVSKIPF